MYQKISIFVIGCIIILLFVQCDPNGTSQRIMPMRQLKPIDTASISKDSLKIPAPKNVMIGKPHTKK